MLQSATVTSMEKFTRVLGQRLAEGLIAELDRPPNACWLFCAPQKGIQELLAGIYDGVLLNTILGPLCAASAFLVRPWSGHMEINTGQLHLAKKAWLRRVNSS